MSSYKADSSNEIIALLLIICDIDVDGPLLHFSFVYVLQLFLHELHLLELGIDIMSQNTFQLYLKYNIFVLNPHSVGESVNHTLQDTNLGFSKLFQDLKPAVDIELLFLIVGNCQIFRSKDTDFLAMQALQFLFCSLFKFVQLDAENRVDKLFSNEAPSLLNHKGLYVF